MKSVLSKIDITCHKGFDGTGVLSSMGPQNETSSPLRLYYQSVLNNGIDTTSETIQVGGILTNSEKQYVSSLENLLIYKSNLQEIPKKSTEIPCVYAELTISLFQDNPILTGNLLSDIGYAIGKIKNYAMKNKYIQKSTILVTGGAGFIGSNLCEALLELNNNVVCLDNLSTGKMGNIKHLISNPNFRFIGGDIRNETDCEKACENVEYVLHQAALGSVPRSIIDPVTSTNVNISGFVNMLVAAKNANVKRFVYAASSSTYGDSKELPKVEAVIGKPLSLYAITKYVNELYAEIFHKTYGLDTIGLRYFNVFGRKQDPNGAYAAVIPKFVMQFMDYESPVIHGDGEYSRDFTYIDNVIQMNILALSTTNKEALNQVYNVAFGERTTLNQLVQILKDKLVKFDAGIAAVDIKYGPNRAGDIPHSLASIDKAKELLGYHPKFSIEQGLEKAVAWYWEHLKEVVVSEK